MKNKLNNIVLIDTYNSIGTGIILPCRYDKADDADYNFYIIITNYHVIHNRERITEPVREVTGEDIHLTIYEKNMEIVSEEDYEIVDIVGTFPISEEEDIAAILVKIRKAFEIEVCCESDGQKEIGEGDFIYTKGFPGILQEEEEAMSVRFAGILQLNSYRLGKMGTYRMEDNYHYYMDYSDEEVFSGLSGGPVFTEENGKVQIIGMNQGVFANSFGDSPYQLVRFIKLRYILEYLRQNGWILYSLLYGKISVIWIKEEKEAVEGWKTEERGNVKEAICILGGSGAGKSSFVESLAQNAKILGTVGDGQTTKTDIYYYLSTYNPNPTVEIVFLEKKSFTEKMYYAVFPDLLALLFKYRFGLEKVDIRIEPYLFLKDNLGYLEAVKDKEGFGNEVEEKYGHIKNYCIGAKENEDLDEIFHCYIDFCYIMNQCLDKIGKQGIKNIFDISTREKIMKNLISLNEYHKDANISFMLNLDLSNFYNEGIKREYKGINITELVKNLRILPDRLKQLYVDDIWKAGELIDKTEDNDKKMRLEEFCKILEEQKGVFSYKEIGYLFHGETEDSSELYEKGVILFGKMLQERPIEGAFFEKENNKKEIENLYGDLYDRVMEKIKYDKAILQKGVSLLDMPLKQKLLVNLCVRSRQSKSLSSFVDYIKVKDSYYYEYAVPIYESRHNEVLLVDTCGLDHIDKGKGNRFTLSERVEQIKRRLEKEKEEYKLNNIIYLKKLDAGKPTEICDIFAFISDMDLEGGLYCVFTGLDIYEKSNSSFFAENKNWHMDRCMEGYPKIMQYLIDEHNKEELLRMCNCVPYRKEDLYRVMSKNVITYCANRELVEKCSKYQKNNLVGIRNLFESIFQKEIDLLQTSIDGNEEKKNYENVICNKEMEVKEELKGLLSIMFDLASVEKWEKYYFKTLEANLVRYERNEKGFAGIHNHTWVHLFMEGYRKVFEKEYAEEFYKLFGEYGKRTYSLIRQMRYKYITDIIDKEEFLQGMYGRCCAIDSENRIINPYIVEQIRREMEKLSRNTEEYAKILKKMTGFGELIRSCPNEFGIDKLTEHFLSSLKAQNKEAEENVINFYDVRADIRSRTDELIKAIMCYGFKKETVKALLCKRVDETQ